MKNVLVILLIVILCSCGKPEGQQQTANVNSTGGTRGAIQTLAECPPGSQEPLCKDWEKRAQNIINMMGAYVTKSIDNRLKAAMGNYTAAHCLNMTEEVMGLRYLVQGVVINDGLRELADKHANGLANKVAANNTHLRNQGINCP